MTRQFCKYMHRRMAEAAQVAPRVYEFSDTDLQEILDRSTKKQSVAIVVFGKVGSGKTSLAETIVRSDNKKSENGWESSTISAYRMCIQVGQVSVNVVDTPGTKDIGAGRHDEDTTQLVGQIVTKKLPFIIICIKMYVSVKLLCLADASLINVQCIVLSSLCSLPA